MASGGDVASIVARKMVALERAVKNNRPALIATIRDAKSVMEREAGRDMGSDLALSNWRRGKPVRVKIRDRFNSDQEVAITPSPIGPMKVITHGRKAGVSNRRRSRGRSYSASRGKGTWDRGREAVYKRAPKTFEREQVKSVVKAFKS